MDLASPHAWERGWLDTLSGRCQMLAGRVIDPVAPDLWESVRSLSAELPSSLTIHERLVTRTQFTTVLARTMQAAGIARRPDVVTTFFSWAASDIAGAGWHEDMVGFIAACAAALERHLRPGIGSDVPDARITAALRFIERHYNQRDLSLARVASQAGLSVSHAGRLIKRLTGLRFTSHLHRTRVKAAEHLLADRTFSLKQIAAAVGYATPSQFSRHFKRLAGTTPNYFRDTLLAARKA